MTPAHYPFKERGLQGPDGVRCLLVSRALWRHVWGAWGEQSQTTSILSKNSCCFLTGGSKGLQCPPENKK